MTIPRPGRPVVGVLLVVALTWPATAAGAAAGRVGPAPGPRAPASAGVGDLVGLPAWDRVPTPSIGSGDNQLYGVDATAPDDVWAVGYSTQDLQDEPLVEHFDGTAWTIAPTPSVGESQSGAQLLAVDAVAPDDVWAVGGYGDTSSLIMHWDGTEWSLVPHPNPGVLQRLFGVSAAGPDDVWAVGYVTSGGVSRTHTLHWDGAAWRVVPSPNGSAGYNELHGVDVVAPDDVWAVGADSGRALTLHWDGTAWQRVAAPSGPLSAVSAVASDDVWAVGTADGNTLTEHWDGTRWLVVPSPGVPVIARLYGVSAVSADDVWAVGESSATGGLVLRWDGTAWQVEPSPARPDPHILRSVVGINADDVVLVGEADFASLVERWDGAALSVQPSADRGVGDNDLRGVHARAADDVWAVGTVERQTLTQHWNGSEFSIVESPSKAGRVNVLEDVDGTSADDVWAVGHHDSIDGIGSRTLAIHWDGADWSLVPTPRRGARNARTQLLGIATVRRDDAWAVGTRESVDTSRAVTLHWDGSSWQAVRNSCGSELSGITAFGTDDVWAAGGATSCHWNGTQWRAVPFGTPTNPQDGIDMADLDGAATDDLWAVGAKFSQCGEGVCVGGEIQHFNGVRWSTTRVGPPALDGVDAIAADDVWAVGSGGVAIWHFGGTGWREVPAPDLAGDGQAQLTSVEGSGPDDLWAVGPQLVGTPDGASLALHARAFSSGALVGHTNVSGAVVSWVGPERGSVTTNAFGDYQVGGLDAGTYRVIVTTEGCQPASRLVTVQAGTTVERDVALTC